MYVSQLICDLELVRSVWDRVYCFNQSALSNWQYRVTWPADCLKIEFGLFKEVKKPLFTLVLGRETLTIDTSNTTKGIWTYPLGSDLFLPNLIFSALDRPELVKPLKEVPKFKPAGEYYFTVQDLLNTLLILGIDCNALKFVLNQNHLKIILGLDHYREQGLGYLYLNTCNEVWVGQHIRALDQPNALFEFITTYAHEPK